MKAIWLVLILIFLPVKCESYQYDKCWDCTVTTKFLERDLIVIGKFPLCDQTQTEMQHFVKINTYSDSILIQTCKCK